jgi:cytochrome oxidase Cu insertion factor (SCO1/SenC/PrrC family)/thiol-disulfide isomerase/thioredoxin
MTEIDNPSARTSEAHRRRPETGPRARRRLLFAGAGVLLAAALAAVGLSATGNGNGGGSSGVVLSGVQMPGISAATANLLALSPSQGSSRIAPDFHLTDQNGNPVSLNQFRGKAVVLSFNDDQCTDVCTLLAEDIVRADQYLGAAGRDHVAFLSVNVNPFYPGVQYVKSWSDSNDLGNVSNWYFGTGPVATLQGIWKQYGIYVGTDPKTQSVTHGTVIEFIAPDGTIRAAADFGQDAVDVDPYSHGLAQAAVDLLPPSERTRVGGPEANAARGTGAGLGQQAPTFALALLRNQHTILNLASLRGEPVVLNFWASSCADCRQELAAFAQEAEQNPKVHFVGIDVADPSTTAAATLARQAGIGYPVVVDQSGQIASSYRITGLPTTVYLDPSGKVAVFHPGAMTAEQLRYTLGQFFPNYTPSGD